MYKSIFKATTFIAMLIYGYVLFIGAFFSIYAPSALNHTYVEERKYLRTVWIFLKHLGGGIKIPSIFLGETIEPSQTIKFFMDLKLSEKSFGVCTQGWDKNDLSIKKQFLIFSLQETDLAFLFTIMGGVKRILCSGGFHDF
jgi:hypothetical protein